MVNSNVMRKARRLMAWFNIKNIENAITLIQYYPNYNYEQFEQLFEQYNIWDVDDCIQQIICPHPGLMNIPIHKPNNKP